MRFNSHESETVIEGIFVKSLLSSSETQAYSGLATYFSENCLGYTIAYTQIQNRPYRLVMIEKCFTALLTKRSNKEIYTYYVRFNPLKKDIK